MNQIQTQNKIISNEILLSRLDEIKGLLITEYLHLKDENAKTDVLNLIDEIKQITDKIRLRGINSIDNLEEKVDFFKKKASKYID